MLAVLAPLFGIGKSYIEGKQAIALEEAQALSRVKVKRMDHNASWESIVAQRSSRFLRWGCALHLFVGLDFTIYLAITGDPNPGVIFEAFQVIPDWYTGLLATMFAWAFGSEPLKQVGGKLVQSWTNRNKDK